MMIRVGMLAGWDQGPFFYQRKAGEPGNWSVKAAGEFLGLSDELVRDLTVWDDEYQATLDLSDLDNMGFDTPEKEHAWIERGKDLAARIKQESSVVASIDYQANGYYKNGTCMF